MDDKIKQFLAAQAFAVIGASTDRNKYGNKVLRCYLQHNKTVYPVNPNALKVEELPCFSTVLSLPEEVRSISMITPPDITEKIVRQAVQKGIKNIWMQPGSESDDAINFCEKHNINLVAKGPCILVVLRFSDSV